MACKNFIVIFSLTDCTFVNKYFNEGVNVYTFWIGL